MIFTPLPRRSRTAEEELHKKKGKHYVYTEGTK